LWAFQQNHSVPAARPPSPSPHFGVEKIIPITSVLLHLFLSYLFSHFQMLKLCCAIIRKTPNGKVVRTYVWRTNVKHFFKSMHIYIIYTDFSVPARLMQMCFKQLCSQNGYINSDAWFTVKRVLHRTRSNLWSNVLLKNAIFKVKISVICLKKTALLRVCPTVIDVLLIIFLLSVKIDL